MKAVHHLPQRQRLSRIGEKRSDRCVLDAQYSSCFTCIELRGRVRVLCVVGFNTWACALALRRRPASLAPSENCLIGRAYASDYPLIAVAHTCGHRLRLRDILCPCCSELGAFPLLAFRGGQIAAFLPFCTLQRQGWLECPVQMGYVCLVFSDSPWVRLQS